MAGATVEAAQVPLMQDERLSDSSPLLLPHRRLRYVARSTARSRSVGIIDVPAERASLCPALASDHAADWAAGA